MATQTVDNDWWKNTLVYTVYLPSFKDSSGDGMGDFRGLTSKLNYFKYLHVKTLMLSPFFPSPMHDNGYDVSDYCSVDPRYGTMEDFDNFMTEAKIRGMNVIIDLPINHTSYKHPWFVQSMKRKPPYTDYYVWAEPRFTESDALPPNNWISVFGGSAWEFVKERDQFYLHQFLPEQPDLNLRNPDVKQEIKEIFIFWLQKGVDGFRIDAASHLFEDLDLQDEPHSKESTAKPDEYEYLDHVHTKGHPENLNILQEWHDFLKAYSVENGKYKVLFAETTEEIPQQMQYYGDMAKPIVDIPFNFALTKLNDSCTPQNLKEAIASWMDAMPTGKIPNWILGNHDHSRLATRVRRSLVVGLQMVTLLLPGVVFWYYGDELAMENVEISVDSMKDTFALRTKPENSRDPYRTPMQWSDKPHAGFTRSSTPWLPLPTNYNTVNVEVQKKNLVSPLHLFKKVMPLRMEPSVQNGILVFPYISREIFSMIRFKENNRSFLIVFNMGTSSHTIDFSKLSNRLPDVGLVEVTNNAYLNGVPECEKHFQSYIKHTTVIYDNERECWKFKLNSVYIVPHEAMVLSF